MFKPLVTIIIPVYNAEKYLEKGLESLLNQTYKNTEIVLIDDKSTDDSWAICKNYHDKYPEKIRTYRHEENTGGPFRARVEGFKLAKGEWITTMDCDDFVEPKYIQNLLDTTENGKYDIAVTGHKRYWEDGKIEKFYWDDYNQTTNDRLSTFYQHLLNNDFWTDPTDTLGQNLFRSDIVKNINYDNISNNIWAEDTYLALSIIANSKNGINFHDFHDFNWLQREGSGSHGGFSQSSDRDVFLKECQKIFNQKKIMGKISKDVPLVSIIIPVYNVEKFIQVCLESVINQTYKNIEIICVNDFSTDGSKDIVDRISKKDRRIITINKEKNEGPNMARATGFKESNGEYIYFLDSDDFIHPQTIFTHLMKIRQTKTDISVSSYIPVEDSNINIKNHKLNIFDNSTDIKNGLYEILNFSLQTEYSNLFPVTAWGKLYKRELFDDFNWLECNYRQYEDNFFMIQLYSKVKKISIMKDLPMYFYRCDDRKNVLSKINKPNNFNGRKLGKIETIDELSEYRVKIIKSSNLNKDHKNATIKSIDSLRLQEMLHRGSQAIEENQFLNEDIRYLKEIWDYNNSLKNEQISRISLNLERALSEIKSLKNSKSYQMTKPLRIVSFAFNNPMEFIKIVKYKTKIRTRINNFIRRHK